MPGLTDRQREVLRMIEVSIEVIGWPPTIREICDAFGFSSTNAANDHLKALENKGYIRRAPGKSRAIRVLRRAS